MIPLRIKLAGFLSYRVEQTLDFEGTTVWMLAGPNGSGKSSVFDALTYALFGYHRSGAGDAGELINKQCDGLSVEFEFAIGGERFRIRRTLKKTARSRTATQQIFRREVPEGDWIAIPETGKKTGFNDWISENIGLRFETFTSSVLLLQGHAERLLSQTPAERFRILADVVDLERYQKLHQRVDDQRKRLAAEYDVLTNQLEGVPKVDPAELSAVKTEQDAAVENRNRLTNALSDLQALAIAAHRWADLQKRLAELRQRRAKAEGLVKDAGTIEREAQRLTELTAVIPLAERALTERGGVETARRTIADLQNTGAAAKANVETIAAQLEAARSKLAQLKDSLKADESAHAHLANERPNLAAAVARFDSLAGQQNELAKSQSQLAALPADLDRQVIQAEAAANELDALDRACPTMLRIYNERAQLLEQTHAARELESRLAQTSARGTELSESLAKLQAQFEDCSRELARTQDAVASTRTLQKQAAERLKAIQTMEDQPSCGLCGQPLTPAHRGQETARRTDELAAAETACRSAAKDNDDALNKHTDAGKQVADTTRDRDAARESYRELKQSLTQCTADIERLRRSLGEGYLELPESLRHRIATAMPTDWSTTEFPTDDDLSAIRHRIGQLPAARLHFQTLQSQQKTANELQRTVDTLRRAIAAVAVESAEAIETTRQKLARCEAELATVAARLTARRAEIGKAEQAAERSGRELDAARAKLAEIDGKLQAERATLALRESAFANAVAALPEVWRPPVEQAGLADLDSWKRELADLNGRRAAERRAELDLARAELAAIASDETRLVSEQESVPPDARRDMAGIETSIASTKSELERAEASVRECGEKLFRLEERQTRRAELAGRQSTVRTDHERHERLSELLGRNRLQMDLVRRAERQIVELANAALDRVSGGSLHLRRRAAEDDREVALDLECINRTTGEAAIAVPFLSGSQRFRVAVSLALGIGRFAGGQHRPIESVIIDEGFGSLDRNGRQVMIQELQNLRGVLKCILLVSHQEEFADAFDDGYRFELVDGATQVTRYARGFG